MTLELRFDHIGIPVSLSQETEFWVPQSECWVTNPRTHPQRIEYLQYSDTENWFDQPTPWQPA